MASDDASTPAFGGLPAGATLSDTYRIERQIALGGMAEVYRAINIHTDEPVAVKVVLPEFARDETITALFKKEATVLSRLHHDAIVHYHLFTVEKEMKRPYMVMEFVDGVPLSDHIKKAPLDPQSARVLITRIASGLAAAHDLGVIHRDLSPDNVILPEDNVARTKIIDFGIAKAGNVGQGTLLGDKFAGKYNFVSPEQLGLAGGEITERSDIYALGLVAAAALLGKPLDMSGNGSHADVIDKRRVLPDLSGIDATLRPIIASMLAPNPADRPADMREVMDLLASSPAFPARTTPPFTTPPRTTPPVSPPLQPPVPDAGTGTVFGADLPPPPPPLRSADPWAEPSAAPARPQSMPPHSMPPHSMPPQQNPYAAGYTGAPAPSIPPQPYPGTTPPAYPSTPPQSFGSPPLTTPPVAPDASGSESPFGPYVAGPNKFQLPPDKKAGKSAARKKSGSPAPLILVGLLAVLAAGGGFAYTQNFFGLLGPAVTPAGPAQPEGPTPPTGDVPGPGGDTPPPAEPPETPPSEPLVADTPPVFPTPEGPPTPETPPVPPLSGAAETVAFVESYPLESCSFATSVAQADRALTIDAFGTRIEPFEKLAADFETRAGFEPQIGLRAIEEPQCAVVDFLREVRGDTVPGPRVAMPAESVTGDAPVQGTLSGAEGWTTDLLLVDQLGTVQNISVFLTGQGDERSFGFQARARDDGSVPMMIVAISSRDGLASTRFVSRQAARVIFPAILSEIEDASGDVAVSAQYFRLGG